MLSPHLQIDALIYSQAGKDVTINAIRDALDRSRGFLSLSAAGAAGTQALTNDQARYGEIELTGAITGARVIQIPAGFDQTITFVNNTTGNFSISVQYGAGTALAIPRGTAAPIRKSGGGAAIFDIARASRYPYFMAERLTSAQALTAAVMATVQFNSASDDVSGSYDASTNFRFTAPCDGLYEFEAAVEIEVTVAGVGAMDSEIVFRLNGTIVRRGERSPGYVTAIGIIRLVSSIRIALSAGDWIDVQAIQNQVGATSRINFGADRTYFLGRCAKIG